MEHDDKKNRPRAEEDTWHLFAGTPISERCGQQPGTSRSSTTTSSPLLPSRSMPRSREILGVRTPRRGSQSGSTYCAKAIPY